MTLRLAFLGCGRVTAKHAKTLAKIAAPTALSFASREGSKAERYRAQFKGTVAFDSYEGAIASSETDAVLIATPPHLHLDLALKGLEAGKHVIVEKPPFFSTQDFRTVLDAGKQAGRQVLIAENYYYKPLACLLRRLLSEGVVGEPRVVQLNAVKRQRVEQDWRSDGEVSGGGALFEGGIHWIHLMNNLGLETRETTGYLDPQDPVQERTSVVAFSYTNGAVGSLMYSWEIPSPLQGLRMSRIFGTQGSILFESNGVFAMSLGKRKRVYFPGFADINGYRAMFQDFVGAILQGRDPELTAGMALRDLEVIESVYDRFRSSEKLC